MRYYDEDDAREMGAPQWMLDALGLNPDYVSWGPDEDYMIVRGSGWNSPMRYESWSDLDIALDDLNEIVNFYFKIQRDNEQCPACGGSGYHPDAQWVSESFYPHSSPFTRPTVGEAQAMAVMDSFGGERFITKAPHLNEMRGRYGKAFSLFADEMRLHRSWNDRITQGEVDALIEGGRLSDWRDGKWNNDPKTADEVNAEQHGGVMGHDAINRGILVRVRCERFGIPVTCERCGGDGRVWTADECRLALVLWLIHPRKGAGRGVEIKDVRQDQLGDACRFVADAAERNAARFASVVSRAVQA